MKKQTIKKLTIIATCCLGMWLLYSFTSLGEYLSLAYIQQKSIYFKTLAEEHYWLAVLAYISLFVGTIALAWPSSVLLTLLGGYLFGALAGAAYAILAVAIGVTLSYLVLTRFLKDTLRQNYKERAERFERAMKEHGVSYLLILNFSAVFPYVIINTLAALSRVPVTTIIWTTILGFVPQALIYAYAGRGLASLKGVNDLFSREIIIAFMLLMLLALVPVLLKRYKKR